MVKFNVDSLRGLLQSRMKQLEGTYIKALYICDAQKRPGDACKIVMKSEIYLRQCRLQL